MRKIEREALDYSRRLDAAIEGLGLPASSAFYQRVKSRSWHVYGLIGAGEFRLATEAAKRGLWIIDGAVRPRPRGPFGRLINWLARLGQ